MAKNKISLTFLSRPVVFIAGLVTSIIVVLWIEKVHPSDFGFYRDIFKREEIIQKRAEYPLRGTRLTLTDEEAEIAKIAWKYFENNFNPENGLVNSVDKYNSTTFWDISSSLHATLSAHEIGILNKEEMAHRIGLALSSIARMPLYRDKLPNKVYNTIHLGMVTYDNRPTETGIGWSSMDIGRFMGACSRIIHNYPEFHPRIRAIIQKWDIQLCIHDAALLGIGLSFKDGVEKEVQEGKLGYEEYCAKGFSRMGFDVSNALLYTDFIRFVDVNGVKIGIDSREVKFHPSYNYTLSDPYVLDGMEYGFDVNSLELGYRVLEAQRKQASRTGKLICVGESHIDKAPYFIYNSIYTNGKTWNCVSENGDDATSLKTFSTAAAFGWYYLFDDSYTQQLFQKAKTLRNSALGFYSGEYEATGEINKAITANVNSMILCALSYKLHGPINNLR